MPRSVLVVCGAVLLAVVALASPAAAHWSQPPETRQPLVAEARVPVCRPGGDTVVLTGTMTVAEEGQYRLLPFHVAPGTTRIELHSTFGDAGSDAPGGDTVVDLGLWDADGTAGPDAFRGWGGSHHGVAHKGLPPVWVQADAASRGFGPGPVEVGTWHAEVGFGNVADGGGWYRVEVTCLDPATGGAPRPDPVDADHVARDAPGWYHGDFHMHALHSSPDGPAHAEVVAHAREVGLDFLPITEYVTTWHHQTWGSVAAANPDVVVWPGREVITYDGHAIVLGETPDSVEYRAGFRQITMGDIQQAALADGALFGIAHPTIFPRPLGDMCRGCHADYLGTIDLRGVTTLEVLTGPVEYDASYVGGPPGGPGIEFPFLQTAVDLWERLLLDGHRITAVSGSDAKDAAGHGVNATAVWAESLSRDGLIDGLRRQRAYVRTRGVHGSPELELTATDGSDTVMIGGTLVADLATLEVSLRGATGQVVDVVRNGLSTIQVPVTSDPFTVEVPMIRGVDGGPLGTFYRVDVREPTGIRSIVSNPVWIASTAPGEPTPTPTPSPDPTTSPTSPRSARPDAGPHDRPLPATGGGSTGTVAVLVLLLAAVSRRRRDVPG